jgi:hypothetical protein
MRSLIPFFSILTLLVASTPLSPARGELPIQDGPKIAARADADDFQLYMEGLSAGLIATKNRTRPAKGFVI